MVGHTPFSHMRACVNIYVNPCGNIRHRTRKETYERETSLKVCGKKMGDNRIHVACRKNRGY